MRELNEKELEQVYGGAPDWELFSDKFLDAVHSPDFVMTAEYKELITIIRTKNWTEVAIKVSPMIANDPLIANIFNECM